MKIKELTRELSKMNPESEVEMLVSFPNLRTGKDLVPETGNENLSQVIGHAGQGTFYTVYALSKNFLIRFQTL